LKVHGESEPFLALQKAIQEEGLMKAAPLLKILTGVSSVKRDSKV
jgi:hypothetical protein